MTAPPGFRHSPESELSRCGAFKLCGFCAFAGDLLTLALADRPVTDGGGPWLETSFRRPRGNAALHPMRREPNTNPGKSGRRTSRRSEERRVGKECRSRWS